MAATISTVTPQPGSRERCSAMALVYAASAAGGMGGDMMVVTVGKGGVPKPWDDAATEPRTHPARFPVASSVAPQAGGIVWGAWAPATADWPGGAQALTA